MEVCRICGGAERLKCFRDDEQLKELLRACANITVKEIIIFLYYKFKQFFFLNFR